MSTNGLPDQRSPERLELMGLYKTTLETWRSQVDSSWQRSSYFSAFEIAAIGGCWLLVSKDSLLWIGAAIGFSFGALLITMIWCLSTAKTWEYVRHWWDSVTELEDALGLGKQQRDFATRLEQKNKCGVRYKWLVCGIPVLFELAWFALFVLSIVRCVCVCHGW